jgi:Ca2+:H+ antiporter
MTLSERANLHRSPSAAESFREPQLSWMVTLLLLTLVTITVSITAEDLVESMDGIETAISKQWVGLVLLPAVSSIAECVTAVNTSVKDQLNLSVSIAVGSSIQTTLLVIPFMVTLGWIIGRPLALLFDPFESVVLYVSVQTMSFVVADGKSNWLEGIILICLYFIIAVSFWFYPVASSLPSELAICV